ncbi:gamma-aminobutyric acid type B receptor subunit 1-like [Oculina patagonica]
MNSTAAISILVILVVSRSLKCNANKTELVISALERRQTNKATSIGVNLAIDVAKNSSDLKAFFDKYNISIDTYYTSEKPSRAIFYATHVLKDRIGGFPLLLLGPNTAAEATSVLKVVKFYKKLMVTYLTTTSDVAELSDQYGFTFAPTAFTFNAATVRLMGHFNWKKAAVVYDFLEEGGLYVKAVGDLVNNPNLEIVGFEAINTGLVLHKNINEDIKSKLKKLKELGAKIFLGEFNKRGAYLVFCELFRMNMFGPEYVWILHPDAGTIEDWDDLAKKDREKSNNKTKTCTKEEFRQAAERAFILGKNILYRTDVNTATASGLTLREVFSKPDVKNLKESEKVEMATAFDTMWAIMLALKEASAALPPSKPLEYNVQKFLGSGYITSVIESKLRNVSFEGLTGPISFTSKREREGIIVVKQFQDGGKELVPIGQHYTKEDKFVLYNATKDTLWKDGRVPLDRSQVDHVPRIIAPELFVVFSTAASIGIVLGIVFLVFNRYYRKYKFIRLSAPLFNDVMVVGCIMCLSTVFLFGLRDFEVPAAAMPPICKARAWILNIGFSLAFGGMFIKTWRIYKICTNKRLKVRLGPLTDWWMLAMVGGIVLIDVALLTAWEVEDPLQWTQFNFTEEKNPDEPYVITIPTLNACTAKYLTVWLALIYVYKGILLLYGLFLAYETRNVVYAHLNDSRVIGICVYNVVVLSTIGAFLALILNNEQYEQLYAAMGVCIIFPATTTISLIFFPKLIHRVKMNSLDDEMGETTINRTRAAYPSFDISTTYNGTEMGGERFVDASSTNQLCVYQNGEAGLSPIPSPKPPAKIQELSPKTLED